MSVPKILVSSTCYDLGEIRNNIKKAIEDLSYEPLLSDHGDIFFDPSIHTHDSCVKAVTECDILIFIIGTRYGGKAVKSAVDLLSLSGDISKNKTFLKFLAEGNVSISQLEVLKAIELNIPVFTFIDNYVYDKHEVYEAHKNDSPSMVYKFKKIKEEDVKYIFEFFNFVRLRIKNNAVFYFNNGDEIISQFKRQLAFYFSSLLKESKFSQIFKSNNFIKARIVEHLSTERSLAFKNLFSEIDSGDTIKILGTGVTRFLEQEEEVETYLQNANNIEILLVNDQIIKNDWHCTSDDFLNQITASINETSEFTIVESNVKVYCPLANLNFLIDKNHFNNYYSRAKYIDKVKDSYDNIAKFKKRIKENKWAGTLEARHFKSFVPMSITAIFPDHSTHKKLLAEFIIPFTQNRIIISSSSDQNEEIYNLFIDFFNNTWGKSTVID